MQNKFELKHILFITFIVVLAIMTFVFTVGYIISSVDPNHSITGYFIAISFVGIFSTFGGAFLGAAISGRYTMKTIRLSENNKIEINKKRAKALKNELLKQTKIALDNARPFDAGGMFTFEEVIYSRVRDTYINRINISLNKISEFKMSESYYYLSDDDITELDDVYELISELIFCIEDLNSRQDDGEKEKNPDFYRIKSTYFANLKTFYSKYK